MPQASRHRSPHRLASYAALVKMPGDPRSLENRHEGGEGRSVKCTDYKSPVPTEDAPTAYASSCTWAELVTQGGCRAVMGTVQTHLVAEHGSHLVGFRSFFFSSDNGGKCPRG